MASSTDSVTTAKWKQKIEATMHNAGNDVQGIIFAVGMSNAKGTGIDMKNVSNTFEKLNFAVFSQKDLDADEMKALATAIGNLKVPKPYKYIAFYYAGHGGIDDKGQEFFKALQPIDSPDNAKYVYLSDIMSPIGMGQKNKCLLFFLDCCMSYSGASPPTKIQTQFLHDNFLIAYGAAFAHKSHGNQKFGGKWTEAFCKHVMDDKSLVSVLEDTNTEVGSSEQISSVTFQLRNTVNLKAGGTSGTTAKDLLKKSPKFKDVFDMLKKQTRHWEQIAIQLELSEDFIAQVEEKRGNDLRLDKVIHKWIESHSKPVTWSQLLQVLDTLDMNTEHQKVTDFLKTEDAIKKYGDLPDFKPIDKL